MTDPLPSDRRAAFPASAQFGSLPVVTALFILVASSSPAAAKYWWNPDKTNQQYAQDHYDCHQEAQQAEARIDDDAHSGLRARYRIVTDYTAFDSCMAARGWELVSKARLSTLESARLDERRQALELAAAQHVQPACSLLGLKAGDDWNSAHQTISRFGGLLQSVDDDGLVELDYLIPTDSGFIGASLNVSGDGRVHGFRIDYGTKLPSSLPLVFAPIPVDTLSALRAEIGGTPDVWATVLGNEQQMSWQTTCPGGVQAEVAFWANGSDYVTGVTTQALATPTTRAPCSRNAVMDEGSESWDCSVSLAQVYARAALTSSSATLPDLPVPVSMLDKLASKGDDKKVWGSTLPTPVAAGWKFFAGHDEGRKICSAKDPTVCLVDATDVAGIQGSPGASVLRAEEPTVALSSLVEQYGPPTFLPMKPSLTAVWIDSQSDRGLILLSDGNGGSQLVWITDADPLANPWRARLLLRSLNLLL